MDKYYGVHVKIILNNNDVVIGHIHGTDDNGSVIIKNASTERANGYNSKDDMLPIMITLIKKLDVLNLNAEQSQQQQQQQQAPPPPQQQPPPPTQQQLYMQQQQQHFQQMQQQQQHLPFPPPPQGFHQMHPFPSPMQFHPSPHAPHVDPAILFHQHSMSQANSPLMHRDPAIISTQQPYDRQSKNDKLSMNDGGHMSNLDPAILFSQSASLSTNQQQPKEQLPSNNTTPNIVQKMFQQQQQQQQPQKQQEQPKQTKQKQQQKQKQAAAPNLKSLDPSILFEQVSKPVADTPSPSIPFQDPAIISVTTTPEIKENNEKPNEKSNEKSNEKPNKKPLFGGKKVKKAVKEVVVFEDYSDFESGKGGVKKAQANNNSNGSKKEVNASSNSSSNASTPNLKKKSNREEQKPSAFSEVVPNVKPTKQTTRSIKKAPIEILSKQTAASSSNIPASLIPPKARRSNSSSPQVPQQEDQQQQKEKTNNKTAVKSARILTVSSGIQIPTVTSGQMESTKNVAKETGLTQAQLVENGAFGISMMVLKAIGGHRRIQPDNHNAAPVIVILVGPTSIGECGIAAARHLANRGCQVIISVTDDSYCGATVEQYKALAKFSGARIVCSTSELPNQYTTPVDLIVDALLGSEIKKMSPAIKHQMNWANTNKAPVLSLDFPSGVCPDDGTFPSSSTNHITPKWTLCLGAPYTGCTSRSVTGELFLADSGLPFTCFQSVVSNFYIPWGSDFVLPLEYA